MILCDVNVLLYAFVADSEHHERCHAEVLRAASSSDGFAISEIVLAAVVRLASNPRVYQPPYSTKQAFAFVNALRLAPAATPILPGRAHWRIFEELVDQTGIRGADTTDAYFAALALEHGCEWWTTDRDFGRFQGLAWRNLLEP